MRKLYEGIGILYVKYYDTHGEEKTFLLLRFPFVVNILSSLYFLFINEGIEKIETLPENKKQKYFDTIKTYYQTKEERIQASKAAYALELITSNF
jgi:hypothetical protein